ncbi:MAG: glycosyltransferase family 1 protein, partial [Deinococcus-Thermus bacterium]|nr:glycosyltransferase family 1 protein [Deinococcota bacterium]
MTAERPRVHWASPLPPAQTDIAHYTARILPELAEETDLTLWTVQETWDPALERHAPVRRIDPFAATPADFAGDRTSTAPDALFVHLGNDWSFHAGLLMLARRIPAIPVVHDLALQELLHGAVHHGFMHRAAYAAGMTRWYGAEMAERGLRMIDDQLEPNAVATVAPGFEIAMESAIGALVHSRPAFETVAARRAVPVHRLELPYRAGPPLDRAAPTGPLRLLQFGFLGINRRVLEVIA